MEEEVLRECFKCKVKFPEKDLETSHDIPRYLGGTDKDGRHLLCKDCHNEYERTILSRCFIELFNILIPFSDDRRSYIPYMNRLKGYISKRKIEIALQVKKEFFGGKYE